MNVEPAQAVLNDPIPEGTPTSLGWIIDLIMNEPLVVLVVAMGIAIWWLARLIARSKKL